MRGRIGVMVELKTPGRYRRHDVVARTVRLLADADALLCFQRAPLEEARALRPGLRTVQHVGIAVSIRGARDAWGAGFKDSRVTRARPPRGAAARPRPARLHRERRAPHARARRRRRRRHLHGPAGAGSSAISGTSSLSVEQRARLRPEAPRRRACRPAARAPSAVGTSAITSTPAPMIFRRVTGPRNVCVTTSPTSVFTPPRCRSPAPTLDRLRAHEHEDALALRPLRAPRRCEASSRRDRRRPRRPFPRAGSSCR